jgi:ketosteroid isomerase-like protein
MKSLWRGVFGASCGAALGALAGCAAPGGFPPCDAPEPAKVRREETAMQATQFEKRQLPEGVLRGERFARLANQLTAENLGLLDEIYAEDVVFEDPIRKIRGREALRRHFADLYAGVADCKFVFEEQIEAGDSVVFTWVMHMRHKTFRPKETLKLPGVSVLKFEGDRVAYHRDYFDLGAMIYERVTGLGFVIRKIKERL